MHQDVWVRRLDGRITRRARALFWLARALGLSVIVFDMQTFNVAHQGSENAQLGIGLDRT